jgi:von Willebrand factor type A domain
LIPLGAFLFLTPKAGLVVFGVALPLAAAVLAATQRARVRDALALLPAKPRVLELASLAAVPILLGIASAGPAVRSPVGKPVRKNAEVIFVVDVSRSMAASSGRNEPTRLDQAKAAALELRVAIPDVPAGISSLTTQLLPHLFPTADGTEFARTLDNSLGVLKPPPPAFQENATTFDPLGALADMGFFSSTATRRVVVLLTDGESTTFFPEAVGQRLRGTGPSPTPFLRPSGQHQIPVKLLIVRFGTAKDRIYHGATVDPGYRPDVNAGAIVTQLAQDAGGSAFDAGQLSAAKAALRAEVESGPSGTQVVSTKTTSLAPYLALVAFIPLGFLVWRRDLTFV